jgi:phenylalanyl-tRNA synthetase beta chain
LAPGLVKAVLYNAERRQGSVRLFEVGSVFRRVEDPPAEPEDGPPVDAPEHLSAVFAFDGDDAWTAAAAWLTLAESLRLADWVMGDRPHLGPEPRVLHIYRSASVSSVAPRQTDQGTVEHPTLLGVVGELDPYLVGQMGLLGSDGRPRRLGWLDLDLDVLLDRQRVPRLSDESRLVSRFPSSDIDLAFVVEDQVPAGSVGRTLRRAGGELLESVDLFDVYRGPSVDDGARSLAFRLRFCAPDRTLTDDEVGGLRTRCVDAVTSRHGARLR